MGGSSRARQGWQAVFLLSAITPGLMACAGDSELGGEASTLSDVDVRVDVLASEVEVAGTVSPLVQSFIADGSGVYWYDGDGAVWAHRQGEPEPVELKPALERRADELLAEFVIGIADDDERLYVGQAFLRTGAVDYFPVPEFEPPGRLLVIPKRGGPARVAVELEDSTITPIASDATRVIVHIAGTAGGYYQLMRSSLELEPLPLRAPFYSSSRDGDTLYWSDAEYPPSLISARFDDAEPELIAQIERNEIDVGPGYVLSRRERLVEPDFYTAQNFVLHDVATGRERALPGLDATISLTTALDTRHAYWFSYEGRRLGGSPSENPLLRLARVDVKSGALTLSNTPRLNPGATIVGHDADNLYVKAENRLLAIEKP